jgi:hypothetical protein
MCKKSNTDNEDPSFIKPYMDSVLPMRKKLRRDNVEPKEMKSKTDIDEPRAAMP